MVTVTVVLESVDVEDCFTDIKLEKNNQDVKDCVWSLFSTPNPATVTVHFTDLEQHKNTDTYKISFSRPEFCKKIKATFVNI